MYTKIFGSKLNTVLLFILIILIIVPLRWTYENTQTKTPSVVKEVPVEKSFIESELKEYKNIKLGLTFLYPSIWGTVSENIYPNDFSNNDSSSFEYYVSFSDMKTITMIGKSNPYTVVGRDMWNVDLTEKDMQKSLFVCDHSIEKIKTKNNIEGIYNFTNTLSGDMQEECKDYIIKNHYAVFDLNTKIQNLVIVAEDMKKEDFINFVGSIMIY